MTERLQKIIAASGLCSRRSAEELIAGGRVCVNGRPAELGNRADPEHDRITVDGQPLALRQPSVYIMLNKPRGYVTTLSDEEGRPTVADLVRDAGTRLFPVGRLDLQSEGLLLMTNDGELMQKLIHPKFEVSKTYLLSASGELRDAERRLGAVTDLDGQPIRPAEVRLIRQVAGTAELSVTIHEGKNRQIRRMCQLCGLRVRTLRRIQEHTLELGTLASGKWRYLTESEICELKKL
ncbi:MAG: rRNA pseudouridine synthase [Oscillibacter sp.]|nr:rRNA pseudouridine synthase [Oscillibacter sp.]